MDFTAYRLLTSCFTQERRDTLIRVSVFDTGKLLLQQSWTAEMKNEKEDIFKSKFQTCT